MYQIPFSKHWPSDPVCGIFFLTLDTGRGKKRPAHTLHTEHCTTHSYNTNCTLHTAYCIQYISKCTMCTVKWTQYISQCTLPIVNIVNYTMHTANISVHVTIHTAHWTLNIFHCILHTAHYIIRQAHVARVGFHTLVLTVKLASPVIYKLNGVAPLVTDPSRNNTIPFHLNIQLNVKQISN